MVALREANTGSGPAFPVLWGDFPMTVSLRAVRALPLLAGFCLMGLALLAVVLGLDVFLVVAGLKGHALLVVGKLLIVSLALTFPIVRGMFAFRRPAKGDDGPSGHPVTPERQPELWAEIREAARASGTRRNAAVGSCAARAARNGRHRRPTPGWAAGLRL